LTPIGTVAQSLPRTDRHGPTGQHERTRTVTTPQALALLAEHNVDAWVDQDGNVLAMEQGWVRHDTAVSGPVTLPTGEVVADGVVMVPYALPVGFGPCPDAAQIREWLGY
jgi:hypothetical protein